MLGTDWSLYGSVIIPTGNRIMASVDDYKNHAAECLRLAQTSLNPTDKAMLLKMAQAWQALAERAERMKRNSSDSDKS